ncbi:MAG: hypothetical protein CO148_07990 [Nitrospirae bacterium CG_4_9_14_3_um_filter_41_27]|nr:DUF1887 family protein [Nitrospirota bacterium]OIP59945.1 MAG: hypothetical protein AUK38_04430 [Nitrospirae bacterium CG2_30_41_42]PIQ93037.1 MAG: hypothetical protein COV68_11980 [Nitrospirae bacterium CG11_big_fil_rev_8_21_14_0_20_41_14]PIW87411.1 MAG: hypothetical protein COZ94_05270 [Nitrospirae bacterium CG_4_8_14_3_um_filter_41_47]PJA79369.1 MAG: hypothetical protein CO148_07990 [Nitrospirae bacterium CG_4_9_14_3_um_filter_41_27]
MKTILISLVSEQTIPNILAIHHFKPDELLFITTDEMQKKRKIEAIINTLRELRLNYEGKSNILVVQEDSILDCHRKIDKWIENREDSEFVVNLTGGTKIMSIAAYEYFKDYSSKMIYIPIPKNEFIIPFPKKSPGKPTELTLRLSVIQYLTAYGLDIVNRARLRGYEEDAIQRKKLSEWIIANYEDLHNILVWLSGNLRSHRDEKELNFEGSFQNANNNEVKLLDNLHLAHDGKFVSKRLTRSEMRYLTGGWLEEFCFNNVLEFVNRGIDDVAIGLKLKNAQGRDNEFDVMFTKENALYFVECKSLDQHDDKDLNVLYKIGALQKEFGLKVKSFLVTTSPYILKNNEIRQSVKARAEQFNTEIIPPAEVRNFRKYLTQKLRLEG